MRQLHPGPMPSSSPSSPARPALWHVIACFAGAAASMGGSLYFAGQQQMPIALTGTAVFVTLGGLGFELASRRATR